jgi:hypothetical protein
MRKNIKRSLVVGHPPSSTMQPRVSAANGLGGGWLVTGGTTHTPV